MSNIRKLYALIVLQNALMVLPVLVPFLQTRGISLEQVFWLQGIYTLTWVVADIPSGYFADLRSRRSALILGSLFMCISTTGFIFGTRFWEFALVEIFFGLGMAFNSGSIQALTFDSLSAAGTPGLFRKTCSHQLSAGFISLAASGVLGGWIAGTWGLEWTVIAMLPFFIAAFFVSLTLREPGHITAPSGHPENMLATVMDTLVHNPPIRAIILTYSLSAALTFSLVWFTQPYQEQLGIPLGWFGVTGAICMFGLAAASQLSHLLERHVDNRRFLVALLCISIGLFSFLTVRVSFTGLICIYICRCTYGALDPLTSDMVNRLAGPHRRATILSIRSFIYNLFFSVLSPFVGYSAHYFSLPHALMMVGIGGGICALPVLWLLARSWGELPVGNKHPTTENH